MHFWLILPCSFLQVCHRVGIIGDEDIGCTHLGSMDTSFVFVYMATQEREQSTAIDVHAQQTACWLAKLRTTFLVPMCTFPVQLTHAFHRLYKCILHLRTHPDCADSTMCRLLHCIAPLISFLHDFDTHSSSSYHHCAQCYHSLSCIPVCTMYLILSEQNTVAWLVWLFFKHGFAAIKNYEAPYSFLAKPRIIRTFRPDSSHIWHCIGCDSMRKSPS